MGLWAAEEGLERAFSDITGLAGRCRFADCSHEEEPGCAVRAALAAGVLDEARFGNYVSLRRELAGLARDRGDLERKLRRGKPNVPNKPAR